VQDDNEDQVYNVVINHEKQYSIWAADREVPLGWSEVGKRGSKAECWNMSSRSGPTCARSACGRQ
jgi:MbtH protein